MTCVVSMDLARHLTDLDCAETRDAAIEARVTELTAEEPGPELLGEMFASGYGYTLAQALCRRIHKAAADTNKESLESNYLAIGQELVSLVSCYRHDTAVVQALREIM